jgi:hypothetical protein
MHPGTSAGMTKTEKLSQSGVMALNSKLTFHRKDVNQFLTQQAPSRQINIAFVICSPKILPVSQATHALSIILYPSFLLMISSATCHNLPKSMNLYYKLDQQ